MNQPAASHPDADTLCDLAAGLLAGTVGEADVQAHVAGCASCADFVALLATTRERLAGLPDEPMPPDVVARIDAALTTEAARGAGQAAPAPASTPVVTPLRASRRSHWQPPAGAVAAGVALLLAGGIGIAVVRSVGERSAPISSLAEGKSAPSASARQDAGGVRDYTPATLADGARALVASRGAAALGPKGTSATPLPSGAQQDTAGSAALARLRSPAQLAACVTELAGAPGVAPLAVDYAQFQSRPAVVIVLPYRDPAKMAVWVVGPACSAGQADTRYFQVVSRTR